MIDGAVFGAAIKDAEPRTSAAGNLWISVTLRSGSGDAAQLVQLSIFGDSVAELGRIERGERIYAEGTIRINEWTGSDGQKRSGLAMSCWRAERPGIGKAKQQKKRETAHYDKPGGQQKQGYRPPPPEPRKEPEFYDEPLPW